jgi:perosamine synthetase
MRAAGIGVNVHYRPVYLHSYYRSLGYAAGECPTAEDAYERMLSIPMSHALTDSEQQRVIDTLISVVGRHER